jgi:hypothetical protein
MQGTLREGKGSVPLTSAFQTSFQIANQGNTNWGSITVLLTSCLTGLDCQLSYSDSKTVKQEVNGTVILRPLVFPVQTLWTLFKQANLRRSTVSSLTFQLGFPVLFLRIFTLAKFNANNKVKTPAPLDSSYLLYLPWPRWDAR